MNFQANQTNDFFRSVGIEFYTENFTHTIAQSAAAEIKDLFQFKEILPRQKLLRKAVAFLYFRQHHLLSLLKKPGIFFQIYLLGISKLLGIRLSFIYILLTFWSLHTQAQINLRSGTPASITISPDGIHSKINNALPIDSTNIIIGKDALKLNTNSRQNIAIGKSALSAFPGSNSTDGNNLAIGHFSQDFFNTSSSSGSGNVSLGSFALNGYEYGFANTAIGSSAMYMESPGNQQVSLNTVIGSSAFSNSYGNKNVAVGESSLYSSPNVNSNTALGFASLENSTGSFNTAIGHTAGQDSDGSNNVFIGNQAGQNQAVSNKLFIANNSTNNPLIWGDFSNQLVGLHAYVGINTKNPVDRLHIYDDEMIPNSYLRISNQFSGITATDGFRIGLSDFLDGVIWNYENKPIKFGTNNFLRMTLNESGKLGLGIDAPNADFHIYRNATSSSFLINNSSVGPGFSDGVAIISSSTGATVINRENTTMSLGSNNSGFLTLHPNNRVGIGLNGLSPNGQLHVHNDDYATAEIRLTNTPTGIDVNDGLAININAAGEAAIQNLENQKISLLSNRVEVSGYLKMGTNAPAIKVKKITGTTSDTEGGSVDELHGLNASKIISITVLVQFSSTSYVPPSYNQVDNYEFNWYSDNTKVYIILKSGNSGFLLSKPYKVLITYEE